MVPAWNYKSTGVLWRVLPADEGRIAGESRDLERKKASFFCLDSVSGRVLWDGAGFGDDWWIGIEAVDGGRMYLHGYSVPDLPGRQGIQAVDLATGRSLWEDRQLHFEFVSGRFLLASSVAGQEKRFFTLDASSGTVTGSWEKGDSPENITELKLPRGVEFPKLVRDPAREIGFWKDITPPATEELAEVIETDRYDILGVCVNAAGLLRQEVRIYRKASAGLVFRDVVYHETPGFTPDSFFLQSPMLCYAKERRTLTAVRIPSPEGTA